MPKKTEYDLELAIMEICRGDTGAGGLVPLTGKTVPVVRFDDLGMTGRLPPIMAVQTRDSSINAGAPERLSIRVVIESFALANSEGLEYQLLERFDEVVTVPNMLLEGIDCSPFQETRSVAFDFGDGRKQAMARYIFTLTR